MATRTHKNGYSSVRIPGLRVPNDFQNAPGLRVGVAFKERMDPDGGFRTRGLEGNGGRVGDRSAKGVFDKRECGAQSVIDPIYDPGFRTKVKRKRQRRQPDVAHTVVPCAEKQTHLRFPETIDGLHRVADQKQCLAIHRLPLPGQPRDQFILALRCVLELVDQQMLDTAIEGKGEVGRSICRAQGGLRSMGDFGKVHPARLPEDQSQLGHGHRQYFHQTFQNVPLNIGEPVRRQRPQPVQAGNRGVIKLYS